MCQSPFKESIEHQIYLPDDNADTVNYLLAYLYSGVYKNKGTAALEIGVLADIYITAEKYALSNLKLQIFKGLLALTINCDTFFPAARKIYEYTPESDMKFRRYFRSKVQEWIQQKDPAPPRLVAALKLCVDQGGACAEDVTEICLKLHSAHITKFEKIFMYYLCTLAKSGRDIKDRLQKFSHDAAPVDPEAELRKYEEEVGHSLNSEVERTKALSNFHKMLDISNKLETNAFLLFKIDPRYGRQPSNDQTGEEALTPGQSDQTGQEETTEALTPAQSDQAAIEEAEAPTDGPSDLVASDDFPPTHYLWGDWPRDFFLYG